MSIAPDVLGRVMQMSDADRAELAKKLLLSLESADFDADAGAVWDAEVESRLARVEHGGYTSVDAGDAIKRARERLDEGKQP